MDLVIHGDGTNDHPGLTAMIGEPLRLIWEGGDGNGGIKGFAIDAWHNHIAPWMSDMWDNHIQPWVENTLIPIMADVFGKVLKETVSAIWHGTSKTDTFMKNGNTVGTGLNTFGAFTDVADMRDAIKSRDVDKVHETERTMGKRLLRMFSPGTAYAYDSFKSIRGNTYIWFYYFS